MTLLLDAASRPIRNVVPYPKWDVDAPTNNAVGSWVPYGSGAIVTTDTHETADRAPTAGNAGRTRVHTMTGTGKWGRRFSLNEPIAVGERASWWMWVKASVEVQVNPGIEWSRPDGITFNGGSTAPLVTLLAGVWTKISHSALAPANTGFFRTVGFTTPVDQTPGFVFKVGPSFGVVGGIVPDWYADGSVPGWRWIGTTGGSASVGYPQTLESIAGAPVVQRTTPGISTYTAPSDPLQGRSLYTVFDTLLTVGIESQLIANVGTNSKTNIGGGGIIAQRIAVPTPGTPPTRVMTRAQSQSGAAAFHTSSAGYDLGIGRHIAASWMKQGDLGFGIIVDAQGELHGTQTAAGGVPLGYMALADPQSSVLPITAILYHDEHDTATRRRIMAWLARTYGAPIPAGY